MSLSILVDMAIESSSGLLRYLQKFFFRLLCNPLSESLGLEFRQGLLPALFETGRRLPYCANPTSHRHPGKEDFSTADDWFPVKSWFVLTDLQNYGLSRK